MPHMVMNWLLTPAIRPSPPTTRMPSAVDSSVALSRDMASRSPASAASRCEVSRTATAMLTGASSLSWASSEQATSPWNSVPSRRTP